MLEQGVGFWMLYITSPVKVFSVRARYLAPITSRTVRVIGSVLTNCPLDECEVLGKLFREENRFGGK